MNDSPLLPPLPIEPALIQGYLVYLGPEETRSVVQEVASSAETLLDRIALAVASADHARTRNLAHDIAGTFGSLGLAIHAAMARAIETGCEQMGEVALGQRMAALMAARGRIAPSALALLDRLLAEPGDER